MNKQLKTTKEIEKLSISELKSYFYTLKSSGGIKSAPEDMTYVLGAMLMISPQASPAIDGFSQTQTYLSNADLDTFIECLSDGINAGLFLDYAKWKKNYHLYSSTNYYYVTKNNLSEILLNEYLKPLSFYNVKKIKSETKIIEALKLLDNQEKPRINHLISPISAAEIRKADQLNSCQSSELINYLLESCGLSFLCTLKKINYKNTSFLLTTITSNSEDYFNLLLNYAKSSNQSNYFHSALKKTINEVDINFQGMSNKTLNTAKEFVKSFGEKNNLNVITKKMLKKNLKKKQETNTDLPTPMPKTKFKI